LNVAIDRIVAGRTFFCFPLHPNMRSAASIIQRRPNIHLENAIRMEPSNMNPQPLFLVPVSLFIMISLVVFSLSWLFFKARRDHHETIRKALELGQPLDPDLLRVFARRTLSPENDLRSGAISICLGLAFFVAAGLNGLTDGSVHSSRIAVLIGVLIIGIGIGHLVASRIATRSNRDRQSPSLNL
jgi:Domain of unknown function (DUF6249)